MTIFWHLSRRACLRLFELSFVLSLCALSGFTQSQTTGRITGTIKDQRGAVIVGAEISTASKTTGQERNVTTGKDGNYSVPLLVPGAYYLRKIFHGMWCTRCRAQVQSGPRSAHFLTKPIN
jgi:hypothetical protein